MGRQGRVGSALVWPRHLAAAGGRAAGTRQVLLAEALQRVPRSDRLVQKLARPFPGGRLRAALPGDILWALAERRLHRRASAWLPPSLHDPLCGGHVMWRMVASVVRVVVR